MTSAASTNAQRVKPAALARMLSVSRQSIHELITRRVIERGDDGLVDVDLARVAIANRVRPGAKSAATLHHAPAPAAALPAPAAGAATPAHEDQAITSFHVAKTLREAAEAKIAQLKLSEMRGNLVRADDVRAAHSRRLAALRESLLQVPSRLAAVLAAEADMQRVHDHLQAEMMHVLEHLAATA